MKKKVVAVAGASVCALALGGGLLAWSANPVGVSNVMAAGTSNQVVACTTETLNVEQGDPTYYSQAGWVISSATVTNVRVQGAYMCNGMTLTLQAFDANGLLLGRNSRPGLPVYGGYINVTFPDFVDGNGNPTVIAMDALDHWTISIT